MLIADYSTKALKKTKGLNKDDIIMKAVSTLISKMEIRLTMPEDEIVKQENDAGEGCKDPNNPNMYFIAKGSCEITVRVNYDIQIDENDESL